MSEPTRADKRINIPLEADLHTRVKVLSVETGKEMKDLIPELLELGLTAYRAAHSKSAE